MANHLHLPGCGHAAEADCCTQPAEFVRLRYYFGQRLGVVDLFDEQGYHAGKQRFHNLRAHGAGVLCGLSASRFATPGTGTPTTVLKVSRGAALDPCGREILVTVDHCVDVAAWFQKHRARLGWAAGDHTVTIALGYRECPSHPGAAPRDPCGCDTGGCEFGRVREGFELKLLTAEEAEHVYDETFPARAGLAEALGALDPAAAVDALVAAPCPEPPADACLGLASVVVTVGGDPLRVTAIGEPDNAIEARASLLSTAALQALVLRQAGGAAGPAPSLGGLTFAHDPTAGTGELRIAVRLATGGTPPAAVELAGPTLAGNARVEIRRFDADQWQAAEVLTALVYEPGPSPHVLVRWTAPKAGTYRVTLTSPTETPVVDRHMRPLVPAPYARHFALAGASGSPLNLIDPPTF